MFLADCCIDVMDCTLTGASCCNVTNSCMSTAPAAPNVGASGSSQQNSNLSSTLAGLANLGTSIAGAVTGRPVIQGKNGGVATLGAKPLVTGQVQANTVLFVVGGALVLIVLIMVNRS